MRNNTIKYEMGGAVQSFSSPMLAQGMQGGLSGFGTSGLGTFADGGILNKDQMDFLDSINNNEKMADGGQAKDLESILARYKAMESQGSKQDETNEFIRKSWEGKNLDDYIMYSDQYKKGGKVASIGDSGIITDKNSMFVGKLALVTGDLGNMYEVNVGGRTTIVKKSGINIIANEEDFYADGGEVNKFESIFNELKKGDVIAVKYGDVVSKNNETKLEVKSKNLVGKGKSWECEKITFSNLNNPNGVKYFAYKRKNGYVGFASGDMAIVITDISIEKKYAEGGELEDMGVDFIEYNGSEIMYEPTYNKYYANDVEFDTLEEAQNFIDSGEMSSDVRGAYERGLFAKGGKTKGGFAKGDKVIGQFRYEYGEGLQPVSLYDNGEQVKGFVSNIKEVDGTSLYYITFDNGEVLMFPDFAIENFISKSSYANGGKFKAKNFRKIEKIDYVGKDKDAVEEKWKVMVVPDAFLEERKLRSVYFNVYAEDESKARAYAKYLYSKKYNAPIDRLSIEIAQSYTELNRFEIKNQYAGKTAEEIWRAMDFQQKRHFLRDHRDVCELTDDSDLYEISWLTWEELNDYPMKQNIVEAFTEHIKEGQYKTGGEVKKPSWIAIYQKGNERKILEVNASSIEEAKLEAEADKKRYRIPKEMFLYDIYRKYADGGESEFSDIEKRNSTKGNLKLKF